MSVNPRLLPSPYRPRRGVELHTRDGNLGSAGAHRGSVQGVIEGLMGLGCLVVRCPESSLMHSLDLKLCLYGSGMKQTHGPGNVARIVRTRSLVA